MHYGEMPAIILLVSITIPKKVSWVDGPSIFEVLIRALILIFSHSKSLAWRLFEHSTEPGEPAVKKFLDSGVDSIHHDYAGGTSGWH